MSHNIELMTSVCPNFQLSNTSQSLGIELKQTDRCETISNNELSDLSVLYPDLYHDQLQASGELQRDLQGNAILGYDEQLDVLQMPKSPTTSLHAVPLSSDKAGPHPAQEIYNSLEPPAVAENYTRYSSFGAKRKRLSDTAIASEPMRARHRNSRLTALLQNRGRLPHGKYHTSETSSLASWLTDISINEPHTQSWFAQLTRWCESIARGEIPSKAGWIIDGSPDWSTHPSTYWSTDWSTDECGIFVTSELSLINRFVAHYVAHHNGLHHLSVGASQLSKRIFVSHHKLWSRPGCYDSSLGSFSGINLNTLWVRCECQRRSEASSTSNSMHLRSLICDLNWSRSAYLVDARFYGLPSRGEHSEEGKKVKRAFSCIMVTFQTAEDAWNIKSRLEDVDKSSCSSYKSKERMCHLRAQYAVQYCKEPQEAGYATKYGLASIAVDHESTRPKEFSQSFLYGRFQHGPPEGDLDVRQSPTRFDDVPKDSRSMLSSNSGFSDNSAPSLTSQISQSSFRSGRSRAEKIKDGYECVTCNKIFDRQCDRDKHWKNAHGPRSHVCAECGHQCLYAKDLTRHLRRVHNKLIL